MTKFKVGDKVKVLDVSKIDLGGNHYFTGMETEVMEIYGDWIHLKNTRGEKGISIRPNEIDAIQLIESKSTKNQRITKLESEIAELLPLKEEVEELKLIVHQLRKPSTVVSNVIVYELVATSPASVEDTIEYEGQQYQKVDREAREGDFVSVSFKNGDCFKPDKFYGPVFKRGKDLVVKADSSTSGKGFEVANVYNDRYGRTPETVDVYELIVEDNPFDWVDEPLDEEKSPNQLRAEIIEKAKGFVENILGEYDTFNTTIGKYKDQCVRPVFQVNEKKRAITVLIYGAFSKELVFKGIAKYHPNNVFNSHIGRAIALGRALGLDVSEFEQAVQPDEFEIGVVVKVLSNGEEVGVAEYSCQENFSLGFVKGNPELFQIINDTNAIYSEVSE